VALAPAIGALVGMGAVFLWARRSEQIARLPLAGSLALTAVWSFILLGRSPAFFPDLRLGVLVLGLLGATMIVTLSLTSRWTRVSIAGLAIAAALAGPAAYAADTVSTPHGGAIPSAGPVVAAGGAGAAFGGGPGAGGIGGGGAGGFRGGLGSPGLNGPGLGVGGRSAGGGFLGASRPSADLVALLTANASRYTWVAATIDANNAAGYQLATGDPVMAIGGFNGTDPTPTLAQFQQYVRDGKIHYFIAGGGGPGSGSASSSASSNAAQIAAWVQQNFAATSVGGVTVYDLTTTVTS